MRFSMSPVFAIRTGMIALSVALSVFLVPPTSQAHKLSAASVTSIAPTNAPNYTVIILDMSGSMSTNDPTGIRCSAASAYINLSGPGDFVGVIGLDNNTGATDSEGFQSAQLWSDPVELSTHKARQDLISTINSKSNNCAPDGNTPTYDALKQALSMLQAAAAKGSIVGSVILLTDGAPYPDDGSAQENAVNSTLRPKFQQSGWPVNTIALGSDTSFHGFLHDLAIPTSGVPYDDAQGPVSGASALNVAPFFVDIFTRNHPHFAQHRSTLTQLDGGATSQDLIVGDFVDHLYVLVTKDQADTQITLTTPGGQVFSQTSPGAEVATDRNYAIFSIDSPQAGYWTVNATGSGQILVQDVVDSSLEVAITQPASSSHALALGQTFTLAATVTQIHQGQKTPISSATVALTAMITSTTAVGAIGYSQEVALSDHDSPGNYQAQVNIPTSASADAYTITVAAKRVSGVAISSASITLRFELFPLPFLLKGAQPVQSVDASVVRWDPFLGSLYAVPFAPMQWLGDVALGPHPANPSADVPGEVMLNGTIYPKATVTGTATRKGSTQTVKVRVLNDGGGHFHVIFPTGSNGQYLVTFQTTGSFADSHGDLGSSTATVLVTITGATLAQEVQAFSWTLVFLLLLILFILIVRFSILPAPVAMYRTSDAEFGDPRRLSTRRSLWQMLLARNVLRSRETFKTPGLLLRIDRHQRVSVRRQRGPTGRLWSRTDNGPLTTSRFTRTTGVKYGRSSAQDNDGEAEFNVKAYTFATATRGAQRTRSSTRTSRNRRPGGRRTRQRPSFWGQLLGQRTRQTTRRSTRDSDQGI